MRPRYRINQHGGSHRASERNASGLKLASVTVCAARIAQLRHRFPAYLCINFKGVSGKVVGHGFPLSPSYSDIPPKIVPDVCTLCRVALATILCRAYHYAQRMRTVYNFHAYTLRFRCLPRPWRARAWRARRLKRGRHLRNRRTP